MPGQRCTCPSQPGYDLSIQEECEEICMWGNYNDQTGNNGNNNSTGGGGGGRTTGNTGNNTQPTDVATTPINPDGTIPDQVILDQTFIDESCLKSVYDAMGKATKFQEYLQQFESDASIVDLKFSTDDNFSQNPNYTDYTNAMAITNSPLTSNEIAIVFNTDSNTTGDITNKPDVFKAVAMIHELLHAEMYRKMLDAVKAAEISGNNLNWANWTSEQFYNDFLDSLENKYFGIFDYFTRYKYSAAEPYEWHNTIEI